LATISKDFGDYRASVDQSIKAIEDKVNASISAKGKGSANVAAGPGEYVVQKGDTLGGIAKKVGISLKALQDLNPNAKATSLRPGQKLKTK
jgi:LysM repeat protein